MLRKPRPLGPSISSTTGPSTLNPHHGYLEIPVAFGYVGLTFLHRGVFGNHPGQWYVAGLVKLESVLVVDFEGWVLMFLAKEAIANR